MAVVAVLVAVTVAVAAPAYAFWTVVSTGNYGLAGASTLTASTVSTSALTATSVGVSWNQPFAATSYSFGQSSGSLAGCPASPGNGTTNCTATSLIPNTSYTWTLTSFLHSWSVAGQASATTSKQATTTTLSNLTPTTAAVGNTFNATATVTGNSGYGTPAGSVVFSLYTSATCSGAASYSTSALSLSAGSVTGGLAPGLGTYYWQATYTPTDSYNLTSTSACSATAINVIAYVATGSPTTTASGGSNMDVNYPAATQAGDVVVLVIVNGNSTSSTVGSAGWTSLANPSMGGTSIMVQTWWHVAGAETKVTLSSFQTGGNGASAWVVTYRGIGTPTTAGVSSGTNASTNSITPANVTTTAANAVVVSLVGIKTNATFSLTTPRGFALRASVGESTTNKALGVADTLAPTATTLTPPTWTEGGSNAQWAYVTAGFVWN